MEPELKVGDKVKVSLKGLERYAKTGSGPKADVRATVVAVRVNGMIRVRKDGYKAPNWYHAEYWERAND